MEGGFEGVVVVVYDGGGHGWFEMTDVREDVDVRLSLPQADCGLCTGKWERHAGIRFRGLSSFVELLASL